MQTVSNHLEVPMYRMTDEEFEVAVAEALDAMPEQFMEALRNVAIVWEEEPSAYHLGHDEEWGRRR